MFEIFVSAGNNQYIMNTMDNKNTRITMPVRKLVDSDIIVSYETKNYTNFTPQSKDLTKLRLNFLKN